VHNVARQTRRLHPAASNLCVAINELGTHFDLLACSLPAHGPEVEHTCIGDDGSVLAHWSGNSSRASAVGTRAFSAPRAS